MVVRDEPSTIRELIDTTAERFGERLASVDGEVRLTYSELRDAVRRVAAWFTAHDITSVALWGPNSLDWLIASLGANYAGAVVVPLNTRYRGPEAVDIVARSHAQLALVQAGFLGFDYVGALESAREQMPELRRVVAFGDDQWSSARAFEPARADERTLVPDAVSHVQFTSGTTGRPKGAMIRHRAMTGTTRDWVRNVGLSAEDRYLIVSPFFHISGHKTGILACVTAGAAIFPQATFEPAAVMRRVQEERITVLPGPPTIYQALLEHPRRCEFDLSSLGLAVTGAASIPPILIGRMFDELGFDRVISAYGITETTGVVTMCRPGDDRDTIAHTSGRVVSDVEIKLVDPDGVAIPTGQSGEILVRGYNVMAGYLDDPEATAEAIDRDGWFRSGDIGQLDEAGNLRITDRLKDLYISGGFNVYPAEVEHLLLQHEAIAEAAVIGVPDARLGEVGMAFVVVRDGYRLDADQLRAWCRERVANFKVPTYVEAIDHLPQNASGKVTKFTLRAIAQAILD